MDDRGLVAQWNAGHGHVITPGAEVRAVNGRAHPLRMLEACLAVGGFSKWAFYTKKDVCFPANRRKTWGTPSPFGVWFRLLEFLGVPSIFILSGDPSLQKTSRNPWKTAYVYLFVKMIEKNGESTPGELGNWGLFRSGALKKAQKLLVPK